MHALHAQLQTDCHVLGELPAATLLLHRNAALHWLILVPHTDARDLLDLDATARELLFTQATHVHRYLRDRLAYPRVNIGALGLVVPQLHLHIVGRKEGDPCWPAPVWGRLPEGPAYTEGDVASLKSDLLRGI